MCGQYEYLYGKHIYIYVLAEVNTYVPPIIYVETHVSIYVNIYGNIVFGIIFLVYLIFSPIPLSFFVFFVGRICCCQYSCSCRRMQYWILVVSTRSRLMYDETEWMLLAYPIQYEHAPLRVRCAMLRKHPPVDPVLSILSCFRKHSVGVCQVVSTVRTQELRGRPRGFVQTSDGGSKRIRLASVDSFIRAMWPNRERRRVLTIEESGGCWVARRTSSFLTKSNHLKPRILRRNHWSSASIRSTSALLTVQHSDAYITRTKFGERALS